MSIVHLVGCLDFIFCIRYRTDHEKETLREGKAIFVEGMTNGNGRITDDDKPYQGFVWYNPQYVFDVYIAAADFTPTYEL